MSTWQKMKLKLLSWFVGFDAVTDYVAKLLNSYLERTNVAANVQKTLAFVDVVLPVLEAAARACPAKWREDYVRVIDAVKFLRDALADGKLSGAEIQAAVEGVKTAVGKWMED